MSFDVQIQHQQIKVLIDLPGEDEILKRIAEGEKNMYALIIRKYNQRLYRIALSIINNESEVEDLMQIAYIKAYENLEKFRSQSSFSTYVSNNTIGGNIRQNKRRFYHDSHFPTLKDVINHYNDHQSLNLTAAEKRDLEEYLKSL